jgi:hypothetical protein
MPFATPSLTVWMGIPALSLLVAALLVWGFGYSAAEGRRRVVMVRAAAGVGAYFAVSGLWLRRPALSGKGRAMLAMMAMSVNAAVALRPPGRSRKRCRSGRSWAYRRFGFRSVVLRKATADGRCRFR